MKYKYFRLVMFKKIFITFMLLLMSTACSDQKLTAGDEIRHFIDAGIRAAENRSVGDLADLISENYQDSKGLNKAQLTKMMRFYFLRHKNIYLMKKIRQITFLSQQEAQVTLLVAMAGSAISDATMLASLRASIYRFELELVKTDDAWQLQSARWHQAAAEDMRGQ